MLLLYMNNKNISLYILYLLIIFIIVYYCIQFIINYITNFEKKCIRNSLIILWDINCKKNFIDYINNSVTITYIDILTSGFIINIGSNYICFMSKHPQEFEELNILFDDLINIIKKYSLGNIISFSTAGSHKYKIGSVVQFISANILNPSKYSLDFNYIKSNNILIKTNILENRSITDTKGFIESSKNQFASGQDEFVIFYISNKLNIPCLTITGISDNDNIKQYDEFGGKLAAKNSIDYFFKYFYIL